MELRCPLPLDPRDHERSARPFNRLARLPDSLRAERATKGKRPRRRKKRGQRRVFIK